MILSPHLIAGAAIASQTRNPVLALILAFLSHYLLDCLPHSEYSVGNLRKGDWKKSLLDFLKVGIDVSFGILIVLFFSKNPLLALAGGFIAILPDGFTFLFFLFPNSKILKKHFDFHESTHIFELKNAPFFWGVLSQAAVILIAVYFLK